LFVIRIEVRLLTSILSSSEEERKGESVVFSYH
jgi:hypothetical protein